MTQITLPAPPQCEPQQFVAGDTVQWLKTVPQYPAASGWTLKYAFKGTSTIANQTATTDASGCYAITVTAAATASATAGVYRLVGWVENSDATQRVTVFDAFLTVLPNVATTTFANLKTASETELDAINAAIAIRLGADVQDYTIDSTRFQKIPIKELYHLRGIVLSKIWREQNPGQFGPSIVTTYGGGRSRNPNDVTSWNDAFIGGQT